MSRERSCGNMEIDIDTIIRFLFFQQVWRNRIPQESDRQDEVKQLRNRIPQGSDQQRAQIFECSSPEFVSYSKGVQQHLSHLQLLAVWRRKVLSCSSCRSFLARLVGASNKLCCMAATGGTRCPVGVDEVKSPLALLLSTSDNTTKYASSVRPTVYH